MPRTPGNRKRPSPRPRAHDSEALEDAGPAGRLPDLLRRVLALGFSGFFLTEEAVRKALGDALPRDWADFAADQSERTRTEFLERLAREVAETLEAVDLGALAQSVLAGHTVEVEAKIRFVPREPDDAPQRFKVSLVSKGRQR